MHVGSERCRKTCCSSRLQSGFLDTGKQRYMSTSGSCGFGNCTWSYCDRSCEAWWVGRVRWNWPALCVASTSKQLCRATDQSEHPPNVITVKNLTSGKVCHPRLAFKMDHGGLRLDNNTVSLHPLWMDWVLGRTDGWIRTASPVQKQEAGSLHRNKGCDFTQNLWCPKPLMIHIHSSITLINPSVPEYVRCLCEALC